MAYQSTPIRRGDTLVHLAKKPFFMVNQAFYGFAGEQFHVTTLLPGSSERALVLEARHTTHIEGTHLTLDQSEKLLAGERLDGVDPAVMELVMVNECISEIYS